MLMMNCPQGLFVFGLRLCPEGHTRTCDPARKVSRAYTVLMVERTNQIEGLRSRNLARKVLVALMGRILIQTYQSFGCSSVPYAHYRFLR